MKITATQVLSVEISKSEQKNIAMKTIKEAFKLPNELDLIDGFFCEVNDYHGSETVKKVRKATESELIAYEVINKIRDNIK